MPAFVKGLIAAAIGGALSAAATVTVDGGDIQGSLMKLGTVAVTGAAIAVGHLFMEKPSTKP